MTSTQLYRHFDAEGRLLYVGVAICTARRSEQHRTGSHWYPKVVRTDVATFPDRASAEKAELAAIRAERPLHNKAHNTPIEESDICKRAVRTLFKETLTVEIPLMEAAANLRKLGADALADELLWYAAKMWGDCSYDDLVATANVERGHVYVTTPKG